MCEIQSCDGSWTDSCEGSEHHVLAMLLVDNAEEPIVPVLTDQDLAAVADLAVSGGQLGLRRCRAKPVDRCARAVLPPRRGAKV